MGSAVIGGDTVGVALIGGDTAGLAPVGRDIVMVGLNVGLELLVGRDLAGLVTDGNVVGRAI